MNIKIDDILHIVTYINHYGYSLALCGIRLDYEFDNFIKINKSLNLNNPNICKECLNKLNQELIAPGKHI